jgi:hypothetical protein
METSQPRSFTVAEFVAREGDEVDVSKLLVWFDLRCGGT